MAIKYYFALHRSMKKMTKPDCQGLRYVMGQIKKGTSTSAVAVQIGATPRHVRRFWAEFYATGLSITPKMPGRQAVRLSPDEVQRVLDERKRKMWACCAPR